MKKTAILLSILSAVTIFSSSMPANTVFADEAKTETTTAVAETAAKTNETETAENVTSESLIAEKVSEKSDVEKLNEINSVGCKVIVSFKNPVDINALKITQSSEYDVKIEGVPQSDITIRMIGYPLDEKPKSVFINLHNVKYLDNSYSDEAVKPENRQAYVTYNEYADNKEMKTYALDTSVYTPSLDLLAVKLNEPGTYSIVKADKVNGKTLTADNEVIAAKTAKN